MRGSLLLAALLASSPARAAVPSCGDVLTSSVTLTSDVDCTGHTGAALTIGDTGVTLDGNGYMIYAPDASVVIEVDEVGDATIKNVTLIGGYTGVDASSDRVTLQDVAVSAYDYALWAEGGEVVVSGSSLDGGTAGLALFYATGPFSISSDTSFGGGANGVYAEGVSELSLNGNTIANTTGVYAGVSVGTLSLSGVDLSGSGGDGLYIGSGTTEVSLDGVTVRGRTYGVFGDAATVTISGSSFLANAYAIVAYGTGWTVSGSYFCSNSADAFVDYTDDGATLTANYWGDSSGPTHPDNASGTGDTITGSELSAFYPWSSGDTISAGLPECSGGSTGYCYYDEDGDGYGGGIVTSDCSGSGWSLFGGDCDDEDPNVHPGHVEYCNGLDDDCDGVYDPGTSADATPWYRDADDDGWGAEGAKRSCDDPGEMWIEQGGDCLDSDPAVNPGAVEVCDHQDNDCDWEIDEEIPYTNWYVDADGDGFGDPANGPVWDCDPGWGYALEGTDCDDQDASRSPGTGEVCNELDDDCDDVADDGLAGLWYIDGDGDGIGADRVTSDLCAAPEGFVAAAGDCDDGDPKIGEDCRSWMSGGGKGCDSRGSGLPARGWMLALLLLVARRPR
jgi:hypothetical protein